MPCVMMQGDNITASVEQRELQERNAAWLSKRVRKHKISIRSEASAQLPADMDCPANEIQS
jgi:hypothetical protein